ncbi:MAG TPA: hypothetical protein VD866_27135 [Urbifossiella sp.]|nr:hypothetical protein [Urbifossiella sp.]
MRYAFLAAVLAAAGCGPLHQPMPARLDDQAQKDVDAAWDAALTPVGKYDRNRWLDALVGTHAYQAGVDTFTLRSEKAFAGGRVVMEVHADRARPGDDRFVVTVFDAAGAVARQERYSRADVEQAVRDLHPNDRAGDEAERARRKAAAEARWKQIEEMFPVRKDDPK